MGLDRQKLEAILTKTAGLYPSTPFSLHLFETLPSTNQKLWNLIEQGAKESGTVVIATEQTAGRGQWGRQWYSSPGGLYLSVAIALNLPVEQSYQLTLCSAWGIAMALRDRGIPVKLKWPNDLILCQRKLGGILTETKVKQGHITQAIVGVGINWNNLVPETGINLQSFQQHELSSAIASLEMLAAVTLLGISFGNQFLQTRINTLLSSYQQLLINIGQVISVNGCSGVIVGVNSTGELRVRLYPYPDAKSASQEICLKPGTISLGYG